ncbi:tautomerase family protein [uncultured Anaerotruncus sp.]|uniref:tautomerase family protein n=1 Tax=uncultured Anaerotruncus sp. TaxID=905011 RepID=UPI00280C15E3|nr:tautomerase family protein [uncultured Anaerotruncus sp.]
MPHIAITMFPGRDDETKKALAVKVQRLICDELKIEEKVVSVSVQDVPKEDWKQSMEQIPPESMFIKSGI